MARNRLYLVAFAAALGLGLSSPALAGDGGGAPEPTPPPVVTADDSIEPDPEVIDVVICSEVTEGEEIPAPGDFQGEVECSDEAGDTIEADPTWDDCIMIEAEPLGGQTPHVSPRKKSGQKLRSVTVCEDSWAATPAP